MVYKWSSTDMCVRCFGVQEHRLPYRGVGCGHKIVTSTG